MRDILHSIQDYCSPVLEPLARVRDIIAKTLVWRIIIATVRTYGEIDGEQRAASFAYYALFSIFPLATLMLSVVTARFVDSNYINSDKVSTYIGQLVPFTKGFLPEISSKLQHAHGTVLTAGAIVILAWTSLRFFQALVLAVNRAWHTQQIPWWQMPLKNIAMLAVVLSAFVLGIVLPTILQSVRKALQALTAFIHDHLPDLDVTGLFRILDLSRYLLGAIVLFYSFSMLYKLAPRKKVTFGQVWFPAVLVTFALQFCQITFVNWIPRFVNYNTIYGTVGGIMLLLFWVYCSGVVIIMGGCLCAAIARVTGKGGNGEISVT